MLMEPYCWLAGIEPHKFHKKEIQKHHIDIVVFWLIAK